VNNNLGMVSSYRQFYNDKLTYQFIDSSWKKPKEWKDKKVLYITTGEKKENLYLQKIPHKNIKDIRFPNTNKDIFAQFWEI
jgi:hypothetical protein